MKKIGITILLLVFSILAMCQTVDIAKLESKNNIFYYEGTLFTGTCFGKHENGKIGLKGKIVDGKMEGEWTWWYSNGQKRRTSNYENNVTEGLTIYWHKNGVKAKEIIFREGKNIDQKLWYEDGTRRPNPQFSEMR